MAVLYIYLLTSQPWLLNDEYWKTNGQLIVRSTGDRREGGRERSEMAYAAVISAKQKIDRLLLHPCQSKWLLTRSEILKSIHKELCLLESFLERYISMQGSRLRVDTLEEPIEDVIDRFEDLVESLISSDRSISESRPGAENDAHLHALLASDELLKIKEEMSSLTEKFTNEDMYYVEDDKQKGSADYATVLPGIDEKILHVGLDEELQHLFEWVTGGSSHLQITSVVGMAGLGKTTLVRNTYVRPEVQNRFHKCFWVTMGPDCNLQETLERLLYQPGIYIEEMHRNLSTEGLGTSLYQALYSNKFFIVLDDVWSSQLWNQLRRFFPDDRNGSRIILTSRLSNVVDNDREGRVYPKHFLCDDDSWELLHSTVFIDSTETCSYELQKLGKMIAKNLEGLPIAIIAVGIHLRTAERSVEYWKKVSEDENMYDILKDDYASILQSISLSYKNLPRRLKACFLYVGVTPNYEILVAKLIKIWIAEGFFGPKFDKIIEDLATECLHELVSHNVVLVHEQSSSSGGIKICGIHFVFRHLCVTEAQKEKFCIVIKNVSSFREGPKWQQRLCIHNNVLLGLKQVHGDMKSVSSARSLLCLGPHHRYLLRLYLSFRLLKVLDALTIHFYEFPQEVLKLVRLRYLAITYGGKIPESISKLWNLEVLIVSRHQSIKSSYAPLYLPMGIWNLRWLRHLHCMGTDVRGPCITDGCDDTQTTLEHLLTLTGVSARSCTKEVVAKLPKLEKLGICIELAQDEVETFSFLGDVAPLLQHLKSFKCVVFGLNSQVIPTVPVFPANIRKLTLCGCGFPWEYSYTINELPNLAVLKLQCNAFRGPVWELHECEFYELEFLLLEDLDIMKWIASYKQFPSLKQLMIQHCYKLQEIPLDIGDIGSLETIEVEDCSISLANSAKEIQEDQRQFGHNLQVHIHCSWDDA